jgi:hypothetical protein
MSHNTTLLDPTGEQSPPQRERVPRPASLAGLTIGLLDIAKARGDVFLNRIEQHLVEQGLVVKRFRKPTFTRVAPIGLKQEITTQCQVVIEALAD